MKTPFKILWALHIYVLLLPILQTINCMKYDTANWIAMFFMRITGCAMPPYMTEALLIKLCLPSIAVLLFAELLYLTYFWSAVLLGGNIIVLVKEKRAGHPVFGEILIMLAFVFLCILGLLSSREMVSAMMSI